MSEENVEIVRRWSEAMGSGRYDEAASALAPDAEWHNTAAFPGPRVIRGATAIEDFWRDLYEAWSPVEDGGGIEEITESGDLVVIGVRAKARGRESGVPIEKRWAHSFRLRGAKVECIKTYGSYVKALEASGLSE